MPSAGQVADKARWYSESDYRFPSGFCLGFSRRCAYAPGGVHDAADACQAAQFRHLAGTPPRGAIIYWTGGSQGYGHVSISEGSGRTWSTDIGYYNGERNALGYVDLVSIAYLNARWGNLRYAGWAEDINGVRISGLAVPSLPTVRLSNLKPGMRNADVTDLQLALRRHGVATFPATGYFGDLTKKAVWHFQKQQGWTGHDADGIPGSNTCALLGLHVI